MLEIDRQKIKELAEKYRLDLVVLFGSQATDRTHAKSDVDIAVGGDGAGSLPLILDLSQVLRREDVEVVDLGRAGPTLWRAVIRDGRLLYEKHPGLFWRWRAYAWKIWMETAWLRKIRDQRLTNWATEYGLRSI